MATTDDPDGSDPELAPGELPPGLTPEQVRSHVIAPPHVRDIRIEEVDPGKERRLDLGLMHAQAGPSPPGAAVHSDIAVFGNAIHTVLKDATVGYEFEVRQHGSKLYELSWNWSRTPIDGNQAWNEHRRMHIASVSKLLTAVAIVKALDERNISYDATIAGYLPSYWATGPKIDQITFAHLLTHMSGFSTGSSSSDFAFMQARVAVGVTLTPGTAYRPENMNFGLCRILLPIVTGMTDRNAGYGAMQDVVWDAVTLALYKGYMQANVFTPAGVDDVGWAPAAGGALAYRQPHRGRPGWDSGDLRSMGGSDGWRLSGAELLDVMHHLRRKGTIVSQQKAQMILDSRFGIDQIIHTPAGRTYAKSGSWGARSGEIEQCAVFVLPEELEAVLFVNSPIGEQSHSLRRLVQDAYEVSLTA
jgi:CubicO group peptidase (beta-lactamase class C family)